MQFFILCKVYMVSCSCVLLHSFNNFDSQQEALVNIFKKFYRT
jgi:hypothetical protein